VREVAKSHQITVYTYHGISYDVKGSVRSKRFRADDIYNTKLLGKADWIWFRIGRVYIYELRRKRPSTVIPKAEIASRLYQES
jgi:hypothetical protein